MVCVLVTQVNPAKTTEPIKMAFGGRQTCVVACVESGANVPLIHLLI